MSGLGPMESADGSRGAGVFPAEWGSPPGSQFSEERAVWVARKVRERTKLTPDAIYRRLAAKDRRLLWTLRLAQLNVRSKP